MNMNCIQNQPKATISVKNLIMLIFNHEENNFEVITFIKEKQKNKIFKKLLKFTDYI